MTDTSKLWPPDSVAPINWWGYLSGKIGAPYPLVRPFLIGLRGVELFTTETHETRSKVSYDDTAILLPPGKLPVVFKFSSHAYQLFSKLSPDVNHDGVGDVGTINPGRYVLTLKGADKIGCPIFELTLPNGNKNIPCARDVAHTGIAQLGSYTADSVLFHTGFDAPLGAEHRSSIACQTCSLPDLKAMRDAGHVIDYELTTADYAVELLRDFDPGTATPMV